MDPKSFLVDFVKSALQTFIKLDEKPWIMKKVDFHVVLTRTIIMIQQKEVQKENILKPHCIRTAYWKKNNRQVNDWIVYAVLTSSLLCFFSLKIQE